MKTLSEILKNETSSPVIFGQVHRRQKSLSPILRDKGTLSYANATVTDLVDYVFILAFNEVLLGSQYMLDTSASDDVSCRENVERYYALEAAGIDHEAQHNIKMEALSVAHKVMCRTVKHWETYSALAALPSDNAELQVAA